MDTRLRAASRNFVLLALPALFLFGAACGTTPALTLTATPETIGGDGQSLVTATAKVTAGGAPAPDGTSVRFTATDGTLEDMNKSPGSTPDTIDIPSTSGAAIALLVVPRRGRGTITITATSSFNGASVTMSQTISLTPAGGLASTLTLTCASQNVGGLVKNLPGAIHVLCTAVAYDANQKPITNASIEPYAEAGDLSWFTDPTSGTQSLIYTINAGATPPIDVDPFDTTGKPRPVCPAACINDPTMCDAEPCWVSSDGITHNPRDGVATLMVAVPGVPGFFDQNSYGEPFVDSYDFTDSSGGPAYQQGEAYIDVNGNGQYDSASASNGAMQDPRMLWTSYRVIWSSDAEISTSTHTSGLSGTVTGTSIKNLTVRLNDSNYNKLASVASSDNFQLSSNCSPDGELSGNAFANAIPLDPTNPGIAFSSTNGQISGPGFPSTYRQETDTNLESYGEPLITDNTGPSVCTITATVTRTYDPGAGENFEANSSISSEAVTNSFSFAAPPDGGT